MWSLVRHGPTFAVTPELAGICMRILSRHPPLTSPPIYTPRILSLLQVRRLFVSPEVTDPATIDLKWNEPDAEGITAFLVGEKGFSAARVEAGIAKLRKARSSGSQSRMDSFFKVVASPAAAAGGAGGPSALGVGAKRKTPDDKKGAKPAAKGAAAKKPAAGKK